MEKEVPRRPWWRGGTGGRPRLVADHTTKNPSQRSQGRGPVPFYPPHSRERLNHSVSRLDRRAPASRSGGVSLLIRYHVEQGRGRALSGSGRPLARTSAGLARGSGGSRSQRSRVLHAIHCAAASPRPSKPRAWFADNRISLCASLRLPARRLLRARREAHPIRDRIEAPVRARQRRRRCPPEPSTPCCT